MGHDRGIVTLVGQRASTVHEGNRFVKPLLASGAAPTLLAMLVGVIGLWYTASVLPKKWALMLILAVTMSGYLGISSWLVYDFHLGSTARNDWRCGGGSASCRSRCGCPLSIARGFTKDKAAIHSV